MILFGSPSCFKEPDDTSWHVEEEEGEDDYRHHPGHDDNKHDDGDHPDDDDNHTMPTWSDAFLSEQIGTGTAGTGQG